MTNDCKETAMPMLFDKPVAAVRVAGDAPDGHCWMLRDHLGRPFPTAVLSDLDVGSGDPHYPTRQEAAEQADALDVPTVVLARLSEPCVLVECSGADCDYRLDEHDEWLRHFEDIDSALSAAEEEGWAVDAASRTALCPECKEAPVTTPTWKITGDDTHENLRLLRADLDGFPPVDLPDGTQAVPHYMEVVVGQRTKTVVNWVVYGVGRPPAQDPKTCVVADAAKAPGSMWADLAKDVHQMASGPNWSAAADHVMRDLTRNPEGGGQ